MVWALSGGQFFGVQSVQSVQATLRNMAIIAISPVALNVGGHLDDGLVVVLWSWCAVESWNEGKGTVVIIRCLEEGGYGSFTAKVDECSQWQRPRTQCFLIAFFLLLLLHFFFIFFCCQQRRLMDK